jgi:hypothetical protein
VALAITGIGDKGALDKERIGFKASTAVDLRNFLVFRTTIGESGFFNRSKDAYWFAPTAVNAGDMVVLYTRTGTDSFLANADGTKTYFRFWNLSEPIFTSAPDGVVLAEVANWTVSNKI